MSRCQTFFRRLRVAVILALVVSLAGRWQIASAGQHVCARCVAPPPAPPPPTVLVAGTDTAGLQVHIVGNRWDTIEVFYKERFHREQIPDSCYLQYNGNVLLAPLSNNASFPDHGGFAVRSGIAVDTARLYAWDGSLKIHTTGPITLEPGCPVEMYWITPNLIKLRSGAGGSRELLVQFADGQFQVVVPASIKVDYIPVPLADRATGRVR